MSRVLIRTKKTGLASSASPTLDCKRVTPWLPARLSPLARLWLAFWEAAIALTWMIWRAVTPICTTPRRLHSMSAPPDDGALTVMRQAQPQLIARGLRLRAMALSSGDPILRKDWPIKVRWQRI